MEISSIPFNSTDWDMSFDKKSHIELVEVLESERDTEKQKKKI